MPAKKLKLSDLHLNNEELVQLFKISTCVNDVALHDLLNVVVGIRGSIEIAFEHLENPSSARRPLDSYLGLAMNQCETLIRSLSKFLARYRTEDFDEQFISRPAELIQILRGAFKNSNLKIGPRSPKSLEILFPENILFGILSELVRNAVAHSPDKGRSILVDWKTEGLQFHCEVHDNGPGFLEKPIEKFQPFDVLRNGLPQKGEGLRILNKIIRLCKGHLLFSTSPKLGGALVQFQFPVSRKYSR